MTRRLAPTGTLHPRSLLIAALGFVMLVAAAISSGNHATQPVFSVAEASQGAAQVSDAVLPKADRDQRARLQMVPSDGDDVPSTVFAALPGYSFPPAAQKSLPDPPFGADATPSLSTRFSAPRAPPLSA
ncbi:hypothetical protein HNE_2379 [Hyphomonas neptunium ATCC 15444]|uniref:Uncharacterized protein n=2 Tax=Hyphomonas TaxID=85 RepID=Q0BZL9_HYPNA|nr:MULTISPECIES: hypothetical protein [Hyphomonas]ABI75363.1 hypothetical protein HNE_2379 [Hyphomonas neptunium ATCC 15444]KCZ95164.1 hypothetical protein HHI_05824 [Hyphomonas hirschiana VP5]